MFLEPLPDLGSGSIFQSRISNVQPGNLEVESQVQICLSGLWPHFYVQMLLHRHHDY